MSVDISTGIATSAKVGSTCTANVQGIITTIEVARDLSVSLGDALVVVKIQGRSRWVAISRLGLAAPPAPDLPPIEVPPPAAPQRGKKVITPVETRSRQGSKWRTDNDDVYQGEFGNGNHVGCVFYGNRVTSLSGATVTSAYIRVRRPDRGGANAAQSTTMRLMTNKTRPSGAVTLTSTTSGPSLRRGETDGSFNIPDSWAQALVDGTAGGIAFYDAGGSPYVIFSGRGDYSSAFTLTINWTR
jgi:hypothetical protein